MEVGLESAMPTYSGGLGVLAGDTIRAAADRGLPLVAVTLVHRKGYFRQKLDSQGEQQELPDEWNVEEFLTEMHPRVSVQIENRKIQLRCWKYDVRGSGGQYVPVYFLDSDLPQNSEYDKTLTHFLYGGDDRYRLGQEVILGIGGVRMLRALGHQGLERFHMNEGHSSLLTLELLEEGLRASGREKASSEDLEEVRRRCVFTTHTPVAAGHDRFPPELAEEILGATAVSRIQRFSHSEDMVNLTYLALNLSRYVNGVARKHGEVSQLMFGGYQVDSITNGVHAGTWASEPFQKLFDDHIPGWRENSGSLRYASGIPGEEIWEAHQQAKRQLIDRIHQTREVGFNLDSFTIGFARRVTAYKRADLLLHDLERLQKIASPTRPLQIVFAGKAHPKDELGKELIRKIFAGQQQLNGSVRLVFLEDYDMDMGRLVTSGVDLWLNTPNPPLEASGTSGMKAALNGVPSLSILDGWWIEGHIEGITGWAIGEDGRMASDDRERHNDAASLYEKLQKVIVPLYYDRRQGYLEVMRHAIALNGSFFNAARMLSEYVGKAYRLYR
jgi:starch phosphorylase